MGLDAPQSPEPVVRAVRRLRRLLDRRVFFQGLENVLGLTCLHLLGPRPQVSAPGVVREYSARVVVLKDERRVAFRHGDRVLVQQSRDQILQAAVNEIDRRHPGSASIFAIGSSHGRVPLGCIVFPPLARRQSFRTLQFRADDKRRGYWLSLAEFYSRSTMVAGECFPVNGFDTRDLVVCQRSELPFPPAARKRTGILVEEPEE